MINTAIIHLLSLLSTCPWTQSWLMNCRRQLGWSDEICCLLRVTSLFFMCLKMTWRRNCPITFPGAWAWEACVFLDSPPLLEDKCNIFLFPVIRKLPWSPWPFRDDRVGPHSGISQLRQHPQCILSGPTHLYMSEWCKHSLTVSSCCLGTASLLQTQLVGLANWDARGQVFPVKTGFLMFCH